MKLPASACVLLICAACSTSSTSENTSDSTEFADSIAMAASEMPVTRDTTYTEVLAPSSFTSPQLDDKVAFVFSPGGLDVYEKADGENVVGNVEWRGKVLLALPLVNNASTDTMTVDGLKGRYVEITYNGESGYVFSGYLVGMPVPDSGSSIIDYFTQNLHLVKPATRTVHECDCDGVGSDAGYEFENGIVVKETSGYESYDNSVVFNNKMTLQEVYLLAKYFYNHLDEQLAEFPTAEFSEEREGGISVSVGADGGHVTGMTIGIGEGCYEEEGISEADGKIVMSANGGC